MSEFLEALRTAAFMRYALVGGLLASVACGIVGAYVVTRRITYLAGGIAHCVLAGMGAAMYARRALGWSWVDPLWGRQWLTPLTGAVVAALLAAGIIGVVTLRFKQREDTTISALWASGMAIGVLFVAKTPGYQQDLMNYLFGNILMIGPDDLTLIVALDAVILATSILFYKQFLAVCFDEEFTRTRGLRVDAYYLALLALTALTVVLLVSVVGIVMVIALLTLPVAVAGLVARRLWQVMLVAVGLSMLLTTAGLALSYGPDLPSGATIIVLAAGVYSAALTVKAGLARGRSRRSANDSI